MDVIVEGGIKKQDPVRRRGSLFTSKGGGTSKTQQVEFEDGKGSQMRRKQVPSATQSAPGVVGKVDQEPICAACGLPVEVDQDVLPGQWGGWIHDGCRKG